MTAPVPAAVYAAARRAWVLSSPDLWADDEVVRAWAERRWPGTHVVKLSPWMVAFWVMSQAAQDGHE